MTIPEGKEFGMTITVNEEDSFLPQDLTNLSTESSSFKLVRLSTLCEVTNGMATITILDAVNGQIQVVLDSTMTTGLEYSRGDAVDNYYLKPTYQAVINLVFTDSTPDRVALVDKVYVAPTGISCA